MKRTAEGRLPGEPEPTMATLEASRAEFRPMGSTVCNPVGVALLVVLTAGWAVAHPTDPDGPAGSPPASSRSSSSGTSPRSRPATDALSGPLTLSDCLALAARNNPGLLAVAEDAVAAEARLKTARARRRPTLGAEGGYTRSLDPQRLTMPRGVVDPVSFSFSEDLFRGELVARLPLFTGGRLANEVKAARLLHEASLDQARRRDEEVAFEVSRAFFSVLAWERAIGAVEFSKGVLLEHRRHVESLIRAQKAAAVDLLRTDVRLANVEQDLVSAQNTLSIQRRVLATLMGLPATGEPIELAGTLDFQEHAPDPTAAVVQAMVQRPDYLAARKQLEAQDRQVAIARAGRAPLAGVFGTYGARANPSDAVDVGTAGIVVSLPLFDGGLTSAQVAEQRAHLAAAEARLRQLELLIHLEVTTAISDLSAGAARVRATETAIAQARESLRIERLKYDLGKGSVTDVLDAQSALLEAETNYYRALADHAIAGAHLDLATGQQP